MHIGLTPVGVGVGKRDGMNSVCPVAQWYARGDALMGANNGPCLIGDEPQNLLGGESGVDLEGSLRQFLQVIGMLPDAQRGLITYTRNFQVRLDAGQQLTCGKWLDQVIIRTCRQTFDGRLFTGTGREEN